MMLGHCSSALAELTISSPNSRYAKMETKLMNPFTFVVFMLTHSGPNKIKIVAQFCLHFHASTIAFKPPKNCTEVRKIVLVFFDHCVEHPRTVER